jgi:hypothetical protein
LARWRYRYQRCQRQLHRHKRRLRSDDQTLIQLLGD